MASIRYSVTERSIRSMDAVKHTQHAKALVESFEDKNKNSRNY
jgi:hypothetical protein